MKALRISLLVLATWIVWLVVSQYFFCAHFATEDPAPFEGSTLYNPYQSVEAGKWIKCNFHAHAKAWSGLTNGHGDANAIHSAYDSLGYGIHCVSNYQYIDSSNAAEDAFIPAYEHGYNISKTHQLVLGSSRVEWLDYLLPQTIHNKQNVLQSLRDTNAVVILNHPEMRRGYTEEDMSRLTGYDCMEVLSPSVISTRQWDAALSAGHRVFIVGNDDIHNVIDKIRLGKMCTFANTSEKKGNRILQALKEGKSYGVVIGERQHFDAIPRLNFLKVDGQKVSIEMDQPAEEITVTGQHGKLLATFRNANRVNFTIKKADCYARATFHYANGTSVYLNPVFFTPASGYHAPVVYEDKRETVLFRTVGAVVLFLWGVLLWILLTGNRSRGYPSGRLVLR